MAENVTEKKLDGYRFEIKDYVAEAEITVTITLQEYRQLVIDSATAEERIRVANAERSKARDEYNSMKFEKERLLNELYKYKDKYGKLPVDEEEAE